MNSSGCAIILIVADSDAKSAWFRGRGQGFSFGAALPIPLQRGIQQFREQRISPPQLGSLSGSSISFNSATARSSTPTSRLQECPVRRAALSTVSSSHQHAGRPDLQREADKASDSPCASHANSLRSVTRSTDSHISPKPIQVRTVSGAPRSSNSSRTPAGQRRDQKVLQKSAQSMRTR